MSDSYVTSNGITYSAIRGATGHGWFVTASRPEPSSYCKVVAGPYTNRDDALYRAAELVAAIEIGLAPDRLIARGLDELAARRVASALGVELGELTEAEVAATAELELAADELGVTL